MEDEIQDEEGCTTLETPDLYFAAFLQVKDCEIIKTKRQANKTIFFFQVPADVDYQKAFFGSQLDIGYVSACKYANAIKNLKTLCHIKSF
jgi:hypothetical protein